MKTDNNKNQYRLLDQAQILSWLDDDAQLMRLRSDRDVIPGGYAAAAIPALVDWASSDLDSDSENIVLRHVNYGGNPFDKSTVLHNVKVSLDGLESAEITLVPFGEGGRYGLLQHVQLRFIFKQGKEPCLLDLAGAETGADPHIADLVFGWVSWQRPDVGWDLRQGMDDDSQSYWLSMRAFTGSQMFLEDTLEGRDWFSYVLRLPGGQKGIIELFKTTVTLGDGVARDTLARMLEGGEKAWLKHTPANCTAEKCKTHENIHHQWNELNERIRQVDPQALAPIHLPPELDTYQPLVRSCATMARYAVLLTVKQLIAAGYDEGVVQDELPEPLLGRTEVWMKEFAHIDLSGMFLRAPLVMRYILRHRESIPLDIPAELDAAGLLQHVDGKRQRIHYSRSSSPYGAPFFV